MSKTISHTLNALKNHPVRTGVGGLGTLWAIDLFGRWQVVTELLSAYYGPTWTLAVILSSPTFKILCLLAVAWALWSIGRAAVKEEERQGKEMADEAARMGQWQAEEAKRLEEYQAENIKAQEQFAEKICSNVLAAMQAPIEMAKISLCAKELSILDAFIEDFRSSVGQYERETARWLGPDSFQISVGDAPPSIGFNTCPMPFFSFQLPIDDDVKWKSVAVDITSDNVGFPRSVHTYDPGNNASARDAIQINRASLKGRLAQFENLASNVRTQLQQMHDALDERIKASG